MAGPGSTISDTEPWDQALAATTQRDTSMRWQQHQAAANTAATGAAYQKLQYYDDELILDDGELPSLSSSKFAASPPSRTAQRQQPAVISPGAASERRKFWAQMTTDDGPDDEIQDLRRRQPRTNSSSQFSEDETIEYGSHDGTATAAPTLCGQTFTALEELCGCVGMTGSNEDNDTLSLVPKVRSTFDSGHNGDQQEHTAIEVEYLEPVRKKSPTKTPAVVSPPSKQPSPRRPSPVQEQPSPPTSRRPSPAKPQPQMEEMMIPEIATAPSEDSGNGQQQRRGRLAERAKKAKHAVQQSRRLRSVDSENRTAEAVLAAPSVEEEQVAVEVEMHDRSLSELDLDDSQVPVTKKKNATLAAIAKKARENFQHTKRGKKEGATPRASDTTVVASHDETKPCDDVYTSFTATEKRMFIKLINGGMPAIEATQQVRNRSHDEAEQPELWNESAEKALEVEDAPILQTQERSSSADDNLEHVDTFPFSRSGKHYYDAVKRDQEEENFAATEAALSALTPTTTAAPKAAADASSQAAFVPKRFGKPRGFSELKNSPVRKVTNHRSSKPENKGKVAAAAEEIENKARANANLGSSPSVVQPSPDATRGIKTESSGITSPIQAKAVGMRTAKKMTRYQKFDASTPTEGRGLPYSSAVAPEKDDGPSVLPAPSGDQNETGSSGVDGSATMDVAMEEYFNATGAERSAQNDSASVYTMGTATTDRTGYTQSTRTRRPGAAKSRLAVQKQLAPAPKRGWHDTIKAAAESTNRVWDPQAGWIDYEEPEIDLSADVPDAAKPLRIDLSKVVQPSRKNTTDEEDGTSPVTRGIVPFPEEWQKERDEMIGETTVGTDSADSSRHKTMPTSNPSSQGELLQEDSSEEDHSVDVEASAKVHPAVDIVTQKMDEGDKSLFNQNNNDSRERSMGSIAVQSIGSDDMELSIETGPQPLVPPKRERSTRRAGQRPVPKLKMSKRDTSPMRLKAPAPRDEPKGGSRSPSPPIESEKASPVESPTDVKEVANADDSQYLDVSEPIQATREGSNPIEREKQRKESPQMEGSFTAAGWMAFLGKKVRAESAAAGSVVVGDRDNAAPGFNIQQERPAPEEERQSTSLNISDLSPINAGDDDDDYSGTEQTYGSSAYGPSPTELRSASFMKRLTECAAPVMSSKRLSGLAPNAICGHPEVSEEDSYLESTIGESTRGGGSRGISSGDFQPRASSVPKLRGVATSSVVSDDFGAKAAYLDAVAIKSMVSRSRRSSSSRRSGRPSGGTSVVSGMSGATDHSAKWSALLEKRRVSGISPLSSRQSGADVSRAAEKYASAKVGEIMEMARLSTRSKTVARSREVHREMDNAGGIDYSVEAAEDLAAARVEAMMTATSSDKLHEGEI